MQATTEKNDTTPNEDRQQTKERLRQELIDGKYSAMLFQSLKWLRSAVPYQYCDCEELEQQLLLYAVDAIDRYDPSIECKFSTFLHDHLRLKCTNYQQYLWIRSVMSDKPRIFPIRDPVTRSPDSHFSFALDAWCVDSGQCVRHEEFSQGHGVAEEALAVKEMIASLTPESREYVEQLLDFPDQEGLILAFKSPHFRSKVEKLTGMTREQIESLSAEVKSKLPRHLGTVS